MGVYLANQELIRHGSEDRLKVQILITDGKGPYNWKYTEEAAENGIIIYTIGLGSNRDEVNEELLKGIAISTGGRYFHAYTAKELPIVLSRIRDLLTKYQDTDGDGIHDYDERWGYGTNPLNIDTDFDGLSDGFEINYVPEPREEWPFIDELR